MEEVAHSLVFPKPQHEQSNPTVQNKLVTIIFKNLHDFYQSLHVAPCHTEIWLGDFSKMFPTAESEHKT